MKKSKLISSVCAMSLLLTPQSLIICNAQTTDVPVQRISTAGAESSDTAAPSELKVTKTDVSFTIDKYPTYTVYPLGDTPHLLGGLYTVSVKLTYSDNKTESKEWHLTQDNYAIDMKITHESGEQKLDTIFRFSADFSSIHDTKIAGTYPVYLKITDESKSVIYAEEKYEVIFTDKPVYNTIGDINDDGIVDGRDASDVLAIYTKTSVGTPASPNEKTRGDVNASGSVDGLDASIILSYYASYSAGNKIPFTEYLSAQQ